MDNASSDTPLDRRVAAAREFNRFYTRRIGVVRGDYLNSRFSLTEARVLYELAHTEGLTASQIGEAMDLDAGYLSRMLRRFAQEGLLTRAAAETDRRQHILTLTEAGRLAFQPLDQRSREEVGAMLAALPEPAQEAVIGSMRTISRMLSHRPSSHWITRSPGPGDIGWVIERHGALYASEYGFNDRFEVLVAQVAGSFLEWHDLEREGGWIAERDGMRLGSVFLMRETDDIGKLRLLLVEPSARGLGIGKGLVETCLEFARTAGYRRVTLWTNDILLAARGIYRSAGFRMMSSAPHCDFGPPMVGEEWELEL